MKKIAIITARGGSKRIPRKNIKDFMGKPMIAYAIEIALQSRIFDEVMVSTDDEEIAEISLKYGASVPFMRSKKTSDDFASTAEVLIEVLEDYKKNEQHFDEICCLYPCIPLLKLETFKKSYFEFHNKADSLVPVCQYSTPIERCFEIKNEKLVIWNKEAFKKRSQDLESKYFDVGMFYFAKTNTFIESKNLVYNAKPFVINEWECQDIDTKEDWLMAELKYKIINRENK